jgi:hypothetical protein
MTTGNTGISLEITVIITYIYVRFLLFYGIMRYTVVILLAAMLIGFGSYTQAAPFWCSTNFNNSCSSSADCDGKLCTTAGICNCNQDPSTPS